MHCSVLLCSFLFFKVYIFACFCLCDLPFYFAVIYCFVIICEHNYVDSFCLSHTLEYANATPIDSVIYKCKCVMFNFVFLFICSKAKQLWFEDNC